MLCVTPVRIRYGNGVTPSVTYKTSQNRCYTRGIATKASRPCEGPGEVRMVIVGEITRPFTGSARPITTFVSFRRGAGCVSSRRRAARRARQWTNSWMGTPTVKKGDGVEVSRTSIPKRAKPVGECGRIFHFLVGRGMIQCCEARCKRQMEIFGGGGIGLVWLKILATLPKSSGATSVSA